MQQYNHQSSRGCRSKYPLSIARQDPQSTWVPPCGRLLKVRAKALEIIATFADDDDPLENFTLTLQRGDRGPVKSYRVALNDHQGNEGIVYQVLDKTDKVIAYAKTPKSNIELEWLQFCNEFDATEAVSAVQHQRNFRYSKVT